MNAQSGSSETPLESRSHAQLSRVLMKFQQLVFAFMPPPGLDMPRPCIPDRITTQIRTNEAECTRIYGQTGIRAWTLRTNQLANARRNATRFDPRGAYMQKLIVQARQPQKKGAICGIGWT